MYLTRRGALVRNLAVAIVNGAITLIILLIAPLGLAAVIINTALVTIATFITAIASDQVILFLTPKKQSKSFHYPENSEDYQPENPNYRHIDRHSA